jgi:tRNA A37 threonylcarbamoyladenosine biosynthesis protein TsaE
MKKVMAMKRKTQKMVAVVVVVVRQSTLLILYQEMTSGKTTLTEKSCNVDLQQVNDSLKVLSL